jgi:hypothetical protein
MAEITINNTKEEILAAIEAERQQRNSPEVIDSAIAEFTRRTGYQDNFYTAQEIGRFMRGSEVTPDNMERAAQERTAWEMPKDQLKRYLEAQGFNRNDLPGYEGYHPVATHDGELTGK